MDNWAFEGSVTACSLSSRRRAAAPQVAQDRSRSARHIPNRGADPVLDWEVAENCDVSCLRGG